MFKSKKKTEFIDLNLHTSIYEEKLQTDDKEYFINLNVDRISGITNYELYYIDKNNDCIGSNSNELKIKSIGAIEKIAVLVGNEPN